MYLGGNDMRMEEYRFNESWIYTVLRIASVFLSVINFLLFLAMRPCWSGISKTLGYSNGKARFLYDFPLYFCVLFALVMISCLIFTAAMKKGHAWPIVYTSIGAVLMAANVIIIKLGAADYLRFIWPNFFKSLGIAVVILIVYFLLTIYPESILVDHKSFRITLIVICIIIALLYLTKFSINFFTCGPVVYAVGDDYQIVFSTSADSTAWVNVGESTYLELSSGSQASSEHVHKIVVPMEALDAAGSYTVYSQQIIYRGPFGGWFGGTIKKSCRFRPVDSSDGITYLSFSDIHMHKDAVLATGSKAGTYDFLVMVGDSVSMVDTFWDADYCNEICSGLTGGEIPVIYARGNHEVKGKYAEDLYKYVGSDKGSFYYTVHLGDVYVMVLDMGEDHDDDWWEYYGTSYYDLYRANQTQFINNELTSGDYKDYDYRLCVCHIPIPYVNYRHNHEAFKNEWTSLLNEFGFDMSLYGHQHEMLVFEPGAVPAGEKLTYNPQYDKGTYNGYLTDFNFPGIMVSKPGRTQSQDDESEDSHIGLLTEVDLVNGRQTCAYINSDGRHVPTVNAFADIDYGTEIVIDMNTGVWEHKN